jgi:hypothetical protein
MGTNLSSWPGVFGQSLGVEGVGVLGAGDGIGVQGTTVNGRGVFGYGTTGVYGEGHGDQQSVGIYGTSGNGTGVFGNSDRAIGVNGYSRAGAGVHGRSEGSYGGVFTSNFAQIRLEPAALTFGPPTGPHVKGEFFVDARGALFYCYGGSPASWTKLAGPSGLKDRVSALFDKVRALLRP